MTLISKRNLYPGVNAHLNSYLQVESGGWKSFHAEHIVDIARVIDEGLPDGYFTRAEMSLQIDELTPDPDDERRILTVPDVSIYRQPVASPSIARQTGTAALPTLRVPLVETIEEEDTLTGLVIYQITSARTSHPIARIELLSPANKPRGSHYEQYLVKRASTLKTGLTLVEIDYLHELRPITRRQPSYPDRHNDATPYAILVSDPRPTLYEGDTEFYLVGVTDKLPIVNLRLQGADSVDINFAEAYRRTYETSRYYATVVDYDDEPVNFDRFHAEDQQHIHELLASIRQQQRP
jgi:hypothetical protein